MAEAFGDRDLIGKTFAVLCVHGGRIVAERYGGAIERFDGPPLIVDRTTPLLSWSVAKSVLHAAIGILVADGLVDADAPAEVPGWQGPDDPRRLITVAQMLQMRDGLAFVEDYVDGTSDVIEMLFGRGKDDVAAFAADRPLAFTPGEHFSYSSGTTNILSGIVARATAPSGGYARFLAERLFTPLGMVSAQPGFDEAGTWIASSFLHATARDFARFGYLYLRDGVWNGERLLPAGWVDRARREISVEEETGDSYGEHWWPLCDGEGSFRAAGYEGQMIVVCPERDLVVVRLGKTAEERTPDLTRWRQDVVSCFAVREDGPGPLA